MVVRLISGCTDHLPNFTLWGLLKIRGTILGGPHVKDYIGYCPHPVTVHIRGPIKGYIYIYITML